MHGAFKSGNEYDEYMLHFCTTDPIEKEKIPLILFVGFFIDETYDLFSEVIMSFNYFDQKIRNFFTSSS